MRFSLSLFLVMVLLLAPIVPGISRNAGGESAPPTLSLLLDSAPNASLIGSFSAPGSLTAPGRVSWQVTFPSSGGQVTFSGGESLALWPLTNPWWVILEVGPVSSLQQAVSSFPDLWQQVGKPIITELSGVLGLSLGPYPSQSAAETDRNRSAGSFPGASVASGRYSFFLETDRIYDLGWAAEEGGVAFQFTSSAPLSYEGKGYRGSLEVFVRVGEEPLLRVVNTLDLESYLYGVLPAEIYPNWAVEAVKAQAVAARTFALRRLQGGTPRKTEGYDLTGTVSDQVYKGYGVEAEASNQAVDDTRGEILTYGGEVISALFHDCSGGMTENNENVFSGPPLPYLRSVSSSGEEANKYFSWTATIATSAFMKAAEKKKGVTLGDLVSLSVLEQGVSGRIKTLEVEGTVGTCTLTGEQLRQVAGLRSSLIIAPGSLTAPGRVLWQNGVPSGGVESLAGDAIIACLSNSGLGSLSMKGAVLLSSLGTASPPDQPILLAAGGPWPLPITSTIPPSTIGIGEVLTFTGHGNGHGLGMPQWGAKARAEEGMNYGAILATYYTGAQLETRY